MASFSSYYGPCGDPAAACKSLLMGKRTMWTFRQKKFSIDSMRRVGVGSPPTRTRKIDYGAAEFANKNAKTVSPCLRVPSFQILHSTTTVRLHTQKKASEINCIHIRLELIAFVIMSALSHRWQILAGLSGSPGLHSLRRCTRKCISCFISRDLGL